MSQIHASPYINRESHRKSQNLSQKHSISHNNQLANSANIAGGNRDIIQQCYEIISSQQAHIDKLTKDNKRKDKIIQSILNKRDGTKIGCISDNSAVSSVEMQKISLQLQKLYINYDRVIQENQVYRTQIVEKQKYIMKVNQEIKEMRDRQKCAKMELEQCKQTMKKLKQAYETKITKLLSQLKNNVEKDVQSSKMKSITLLTEQKYIDNNEQKRSSHRKEISYSPAHRIVNFVLSNQIRTPLKSQNQNISNRKETGTQEKSEDNWVLNIQNKLDNFETQAKKLINTPYRRPNQNFIYSSSKMFPSASTQMSTRDHHPGISNLVNHQKMLGKVLDAQYSADYYEYSSSNSSEQEDSHQPNETQNYDQNNHEYEGSNISKNSNKISVQQIVRKFGEHYSKYERQQNNESVRIRPENIKKQNGKIPQFVQKSKQEKQFAKIKFNHVLEELRKRVKKFQNQEIQEI